jgi:hypothetical protein
MNIFCTECGLQLLTHMSFCPRCGTRKDLGVDVEKSGGESRFVGKHSLRELFPVHWAKGVAGSFACWKWSTIDIHEAQMRADKRAGELRAAYMKSRQPPKKYIYADQRLREEVIESRSNIVITRNTYGALILNTDLALFIDVDAPENSNMDQFERQQVAKIQSWIKGRANWGMRIYRTAAGLRLLATHAVFDPSDGSIDNILVELDSDPLYRTLCRVQKCFRARLSPKPWRCNLAPPPNRWPRHELNDQSAFNNWLRRYDMVSKNFSACWLVTKLGIGIIDKQIAPIVEMHDKIGRVSMRLPLA